MNDNNMDEETKKQTSTKLIFEHEGYIHASATVNERLLNSRSEEESKLLRKQLRHAIDASIITRDKILVIMNNMK